MRSTRARLVAVPLAVSLIPLGVAASAAAGVVPREDGASRVGTRAHTDLRVMTWNIQHGSPNRGASEPADLERIANVIRAENPDVVALNEVHDDEDFPDSHGHQPAVLKRKLAQDGYEYAYYGGAETPPDQDHRACGEK